MTPIKHAKQMISILLMILLVCPSSVAANEKTQYEMGLEEEANGELAIALNHYNAVPDSDPQIKVVRAARNRVQLAQKKKRNNADEAEKVKLEIDREVAKCNQLRKNGDPLAQRSNERIQELQSRVVELTNKPYEHVGAKKLNAELAPLARVDRMRDNPDGLLQIIEESDPNSPQAQMASFLMAAYTKGRYDEAFEGCQTARRNGDTKTGQEVCARIPILQRETEAHVNRANLKVLSSRALPSKAWHDNRPFAAPQLAIETTAVSLGENKIVVESLAPKEIQIPIETAETKVVDAPASSTSTWIPWAIGATVTVVVVAVTAVIIKAQTKSTAAAAAASLNAVVNHAAAPAATGMASAASSAALDALSGQKMDYLKMVAGAWVNKPTGASLNALLECLGKEGITFVKEGKTLAGRQLRLITKMPPDGTLASAMIQYVISLVPAL